MYFYKLTTGEHDDQREIILMHMIEFGEKEFVALTKRAESKCKEEGGGGFMDVSDILVEEFGFKEIHYEGRSHYVEWLRRWE